MLPGEIIPREHRSRIMALALVVVFACALILLSSSITAHASNTASIMAILDPLHPQRVHILPDSSQLRHAGFRADESPVWPELKFTWQCVLGSVIGFLGAAMGTAGGGGGGAFYVPMLNLIIGFDAKSSTALSKCMIMGAAVSTVWFNLRLKHPLQDSSIIDYDLALLLQPTLLLGISIGVIFNVIFPSWIITVLTVIIFIGVGTRACGKAVNVWKQETSEMRRLAERKLAATHNIEEEEQNGDYKTLSADREVTIMDTLRTNIGWKSVAVLLYVWVGFFILQILKSRSQTYSVVYWILNILQVPVAVPVFLAVAMRLHRRGKTDNEVETSGGGGEVNQFRISKLALCGLGGLVGGILGGLLGVGGGFALGPVMLELGVHPQVLTATATFAMIFSSSLSVVEYHLLHRFPVPYALYLIAVSFAGGYSGQYIIRKLVHLCGRASIIVFLLASITIASALTLGVVGVVNDILKWKRGEDMGFVQLC